MRRLKFTMFMLWAVGAAPVAQPAEISCIATYSNGGPAADRANKMWPSGFRPTASSCATALMDGPIVNGDYERFRDFYRQHYRSLLNLYLMSPGGDVGEAIKIGRIVRRYMLSAVTADLLDEKTEHFMLGFPGSRNPCFGPSCACASSCGLIWLGAINRTGTVGLHRPKITDPQFAVLPPGRASSAYREAMQRVSQYVDEMEAPRQLIDTMITTGSSDVRWLSADDSANQLVHPPSFEEWVNAACGSITAQEQKSRLALQKRHSSWLYERNVRPQVPAQAQPLNAQELSNMRALDEKHTHRYHCWITRVFAHRDALPPP